MSFTAALLFALTTHAAPALPPGVAKPTVNKKRARKRKKRKVVRLRLEPTRRKPVPTAKVRPQLKLNRPKLTVSPGDVIPGPKLAFDLRDGKPNSLKFVAEDLQAMFTDEALVPYPTMMVINANGRLWFRVKRAWFDGSDVKLRCDGFFVSKDLLVEVLSDDGRMQEGHVTVGKPDSKINVTLMTSEISPDADGPFDIVVRRPEGTTDGFGVSACRLEKVDP